MPASILKDTFLESRIYFGRLLLASVIILSLLGVLVGRYSYLQITQHDIYKTQSDRNRVHVQSVPPTRGLIYDRYGKLLAENQPSYTLTLVKERVKDLPQSLSLLQALLTVSDAEIEKFNKRQRSRRPFEGVPLRFRLSEEEIALLAVNRYRLPGVEVKAELVRNYPYGELFAHTVGYVGRINEREQKRIDPVNYAGSHHIGKIGLEKKYQELLHGQVGFENVETDARGRVLRVLERTDPVPGADIQLFIDSKVQEVAYSALLGADGHSRGSLVAIDPKTGGVIAIVSTPSFNPNYFVNGISNKNYSALRDSLDLPLFNRSLQGQYPPGSTVKPIFGLAGLDYGTITPQSVIYDPGWYRLPNDERRYRDWTWAVRRGGHGKKVDLHQAIVESCDTYFYDLAYKLGIDNIHEFGSKFGLGKLSHIDLTSESKGLLPSRQWKRDNYRSPWFPGETLSLGIGQGYMLTTPLQLAISTATIASRGIRMQPRVLKSINGEEQEPVVAEVIELQDEQSWQVTIDGMRDVIHSIKGTARRIGKGAQYKMAGKTGTAQVVGIKQGEKYDEEMVAIRNRDHALFVGFAPLENPQIAIAVIVENAGHGGSKAAPIARKVFDAYLLPRLAKDEKK